MKNNFSQYNQPAVALVGAGPGDPGLLTLKAFNYIRNCDVLLFDSLLGEDILDLVQSHVEKIFVGKTYGDMQDQSERQMRINKLIIDNVEQGKKVVRLKTGDPLMFSRGVEEIKFLLENKIDFEIVPGITAAMAGACEFGIPLTERFNSSSVIFITGQLAKEKVFTVNHFSQFLHDGGCLVIYMGLKLLNQICSSLKEEGFGKELKFILAGNISTNKQEFKEGDLTDIELKSEQMHTPAIVYIGKNIKALRQVTLPQKH